MIPLYLLFVNKKSCDVHSPQDFIDFYFRPFAFFPFETGFFAGFAVLPLGEDFFVFKGDFFAILALALGFTFAEDDFAGVFSFSLMLASRACVISYFGLNISRMIVES
jgi:hypothetical protein